MSYITEYRQKFEELNIRIKNQDQIRKQANGGNSILFSYPPNEEHLYFQKAREIYNEIAFFIDISKFFVQFINNDGWESFKDYYNDYKETPDKVFKSDDNDTPALFNLIINEIEKISTNNKIPFLIRTGCLYGTGINNQNIMEHRSVINSPNPLVIFYPSRIEDNNLYFLNFKPASKYRCVLVK